MRGKWRKTVLFALVLATLIALAYQSRNAIDLETFSWQRLWDAVAETRKLPLIAALLAIYAAYAVRAWRWQRFCRYLGSPKFIDVYTATLMGFAGVFLLGRAGEPVRPLLISRKCRLPVLSMFGVYILERLVDVAATAALIGFSLLFSPSLRASTSARDGWEAKIRLAGVLMI